jgi:cytochrome b561
MLFNAYNYSQPRIRFVQVVSPYSHRPDEKIMSNESLPARYHPLHVAIHWIMAILVLTSIFYVMLYLDDVPNTSAKLIPYSVHVGIGAILGVLLLVRLYMRFRVPRPAPADAGHPVLNMAARVVHFLLYAGVAAMLFIGYGMFNEADILGVYRGENTFPQDFHTLSMREIHGAVGYSLLLLVIIHFSAAMYHQFIRKDNLLGRMWFGKR